MATEAYTPEEATDKPRRICHTPEEAFQAGRQLVRDKGWKLSPERADLIAAMLRPYLRRDDATPAA